MGKEQKLEDTCNLPPEEFSFKVPHILTVSKY